MGTVRNALRVRFDAADARLGDLTDVRDVPSTLDAIAAAMTSLQVALTPLAPPRLTIDDDAYASVLAVTCRAIVVTDEGSAFRELGLADVYVPQDVRASDDFYIAVLELPLKQVAELIARGDLPEEALLRAERRVAHFEEQPLISTEALWGDTLSTGLSRCVILGAPGAGKTSLLREHGLAVESLAAVEIDPTYIEDYKLRDIYDVVQQGDAADLPDVGPDAAWDLVILGDVLEHFRKSRGVDLLDYLYYRTKHILLVIPVDYVQGSWEGHGAEAHISVWRPEDFQNYRAGLIVARTDGGQETLLVMINGLRARRGEDHMFG